LSTPGTALQTLDDERNSVVAYINRLKPQLALALPKHMTPDRMARIVLTSIRKTPKLLSCRKESLAAAILTAAQLGLEIDGTEASLVPYGTECTLIPGYRGLVKLMWQSGMVESISMEVVREGDGFTYTKGDDEKITHIPGDPASKGWPRDAKGQPLDDEDREITHAYAIVTIKGGGRVRKVMRRSELEALRLKMASKQRNPQTSTWNTNFAEMCQKTVIRRVAKLVPSSSERAIFLNAAVKLDEEAERGEHQEMFLVPPQIEAGASPALDDLTEKLADKTLSTGLAERLSGPATEPAPTSGPLPAAQSSAPDSGVIPFDGPECAGCGKNSPDCDAQDNEGRAWHSNCKRVVEIAERSAKAKAGK